MHFSEGKGMLTFLDKETKGSLRVVESVKR
jgi:hypothetical protein